MKKATYWSYTGEGTNRSDKASSRYDDAVQHAKDAVKADTEGRYDDAVASYTSACEDFLMALQFKIVRATKGTQIVAVHPKHFATLTGKGRLCECGWH